MNVQEEKDDTSDIRTIVLTEEKEKTVHFIKKKIPRLETKTWKLTCNDLCHEAQLIILNNIVSSNSNSNSNSNLKGEHGNFFIVHLKAKIRNYRQQDISKHMLDAEQFVPLSEVLQLLHRCQMKCAYCSHEVYVFYHFRREPYQWTLDRIYNDYGHNRDNLIIACLDCNLKRRCISKRAFMSTKKMIVEKIN